MCIMNMNYIKDCSAVVMMQVPGVHKAVKLITVC
jgi:hypothetical protein